MHTHVHLFTSTSNTNESSLTHNRLVMGMEEPDKVSDRLLGYSLETASAMNYLSNRSYVHRDIAARNILLDANYVSKVNTVLSTYVHTYIHETSNIILFSGVWKTVIIVQEMLDFQSYVCSIICLG